MAVTLQAIKKSGAADGSSITVSFTKVTRSLKDKKQVTPIPGKNHILIPLGSEGPTLNVEFRLFGSAEFNKLEPWLPGLTIHVSSSTVPELPAIARDPSTAGSNGSNCSVWNLDDVKSERVGGQFDEWDVTLMLTRYWNWVKK